jgi:diguanylate cyclase (GGDEF)-like protein
MSEAPKKSTPRRKPASRRSIVGLSLLEHISGMEKLLKHPEDLLSSVLEPLITEVSAGGALVYIFGDDDKTLIQEARAGEVPASFGTLRTRPGAKLAKTVLETGTPLSLKKSDLPKDVTDASNVLGLPILFRDRIIGVLEVFNRKGKRGFTEDDIHLGRVVANYVAVSLAEIALFRKLEIKTSKLKERVKTANSEIARLTEKAKTLSVRDPLTGLTNRFHFYDLLALEIRRSKRSENVFSLILLDVDDFKSLNTRHGLQVGDRIIREVGRVLRRCARKSDIVARYRGREFSVILPETQVDRALKFAHRVQERVNRLDVKGANRRLRVTVSMGIAQFHPDSATHPEKLLMLAKLALAEGSKEGPNKIVVSRVDRSGSEGPDRASDG